MSGLVIGTGIANQPWELYALFVIITLLRVLTVYYNWTLPFRSLKRDSEIA